MNFEKENFPKHRPTSPFVMFSIQHIWPENKRILFSFKIGDFLLFLLQKGRIITLY